MKWTVSSLLFKLWTHRYTLRTVFSSQLASVCVFPSPVVHSLSALRRHSYSTCQDNIMELTQPHLLTYLLTPWCRVLLEKLTDLQLVKKSPAFHGTRRFITVLTSVRHLSLSWASPIQSIYPHPTSTRSILILSTHLRLGLPSGLFPSGFSTKTLSYAAISFIKVFPDCNTSHKIRRFGMSLGLM